MSGMYFSAGSSRTTAISHRCANLFVVAALLLSTAAAAIVFNPRSAAAATATTTTALNLRARGSTSSAVKLVMPAGATVEIVRRLSTGWYRILYQGVGGYAHGDYLSTGGGGSSSGGGGGSSSGGATGNARTTSSLNLRAGPSTSDRVLLVMPSGATVSLTGETSNGFLRMTYQGTRGWAHGSYISTSGSSGGGSGQSGGSDADPGSGNAGSARTTSALNLRSGPTTSSRVLLVIPSGAAVTLTGTNSGGFQGVTYNGTTGWASSNYLTSGGGTSGGGGGGASGPSGNYDTNGDGVWQRDEIIAIIYAAADYYGQPRGDMLRVAQCESGLDPYNVTPPYNASGLFQFLPGTWASTPYANQNILNPVSSAFAAGWMWSAGRRGEWVCQ